MKCTSTLAPLALLAAVAAPAFSQVRVGPSIRTDSSPGDAVSTEPSASASFADPLFSIGGISDDRITTKTRFSYTQDGGVNWQTILIRPPAPNQSGTEGDPMTCYDPRTGSIWAGGISFVGAFGGPYAARYDPLTGTFAPSAIISGTGGADKGWMAAGPAPNNPGQTRVYTAYNQGVARSSDMGETWQGPVSLGPGLGFLPRVASDGKVHVVYYDLGTRHLIRSSSNGGLTWSAATTVADRMDTWPLDCTRIAGTFRVPSLQGFAVHPSDPERMYFVFPDTTAFTGTEADVDTYFTKSSDSGATWSTPTVINADGPFVGDQWFPWIEVDEEARLHVTYYDSRNTDQLDAASENVFDAYYAISTDDGAIWTEARLTESSFSSVDAGTAGSFVGDYIGLSVAGSRAIPQYMRTDPTSKSDLHVNVILVDEAQEFCRGIRCPCGNVDPQRGCANLGFDNDPSTGAELSASGSPSIAADDLVMTIDGVGAGEFGLLAVGESAGSATVGDGQLCLGGTLVRYPIFQVSAAGTASVGPGTIVSFAASMPIGNPSVGQTWYFQSFYRDPGGPCSTNFNFTNALAVTWEL